MSIHVLELPPRFHTALLHIAEDRIPGVLTHGPYGEQLPPPLPLGWHNTSGALLPPTTPSHLPSTR